MKARCSGRSRLRSGVRALRGDAIRLARSNQDTGAEQMRQFADHVRRQLQTKLRASTHGAFPADHLDEATERLFELAQSPVLEERDFFEAVQLFEGRHELGEDRIG